MALHDPSNRLSLVRDGLERLLRSRLCASTPAQLGYLAGLTGDRAWMARYSQKVMKQRDHCLKTNRWHWGFGWSNLVVHYMFIRLTDEHWAADDKGFVLRLLHEEHVLLVHGSGFSPELGRPCPPRLFG